MNRILISIRCRWSLQLLLPLLLTMAGRDSFAQTLQKGANVGGVKDARLSIEKIEYRAASWESTALREAEQDTPNRGGLIHVYVKNITQEPVSLAYYRLNGKDESHWFLGRFVAWHRYMDRQLAPGQMSVLEVNAVSELFSEGKPLEVSLIDRTWTPAVRASSVLETDKARVSSIILSEDLRELLFHVRYVGEADVRVLSAEVVGHSSHRVEWKRHSANGCTHAIGELTLDKPLDPSALVILKVQLEQAGKQRFVYAHRRAHPDRFPIGTWTGTPDTFAMQRRIHIDTIVQGGSSVDPFYAKHIPRYGFRTIVPNAEGRNKSMMKDLGSKPGVICWMLSDEPDWVRLPSTMLFADESTKHINRTVPTMITLCRNVKFFEYASIPDIPCMDHYCVGAPTSSEWPHKYGTRLEETGHYTRDLKEASEPKPIWVWSQGIADWDERPKRYVPTPAELAAQLMLNLGRGAKGILWFNFSLKAANDYPDAVAAMGDWGRVMRCVRSDLLRADPIRLETESPPKLDVATLASPEALFLFITNQDYEIDDQAYPFRKQCDVRVSVELPSWIRAKDVYAITSNGIEDLPFEVTEGKAIIRPGDIDVCRLVAVVPEGRSKQRHQQEYENARADETRTF